MDGVPHLLELPLEQGMAQHAPQHRRHDVQQRWLRCSRVVHHQDGRHQPPHIGAEGTAHSMSGQEPSLMLGLVTDVGVWDLLHAGGSQALHLVCEAWLRVAVWAARVSCDQGMPQWAQEQD